MTVRKSYRLDVVTAAKLEKLKEAVPSMNETQLVQAAIDAYYIDWHNRYPDCFPLGHINLVGMQ